MQTVLIFTGIYMCFPTSQDFYEEALRQTDSECVVISLVFIDMLSVTGRREQSRRNEGEWL